MIEVGDIKAYPTWQAAELMGLPEHTIKYYIKHGKLPARRIGRYNYITEKNLQEFINGDCEVAQSERGIT